MLDWLPWVLLAVVLFFWIGGQRYSQNKRLALESYVIYLLLDDLIRDDGKAKFVGWIAKTPSTTAFEFGHRARRAVGQYADDLHDAPELSSLVAANAMVWNAKQEVTNVAPVPTQGPA